MRYTLLTLVAAAALTLILSPSIRAAALRGLFAQDQPETPGDWLPRHRHWVHGVEVQR